MLLCQIRLMKTRQRSTAFEVDDDAAGAQNATPIGLLGTVLTDSDTDSSP